MTERKLVYPTAMSDVSRKSSHAIRICRNASAGNFTHIRIPEHPSRTIKTMFLLEEVLPWCRRVLRPWGPEQEAQLIASAVPESRFGLPAGGDNE